MSEASENFLAHFLSEHGEDTLAHYASEYYDPQKAHDYYERTKQLKGRQPGMTEAQQKQARADRYEQSKAIRFANKNIQAKKKGELTALQVKQKARQAAMRKKAEETKKQIIARVNAQVAKIKADLLASIKMPELNKIPEDASPKQRAFLERQNASIRERYRNDANSKAKAAGAQMTGAQKQARGQLQKLNKDLSAALTKARTDYAANVKKTQANYKKIAETEKSNIQKAIKGTVAPPKPRKPRAPRKSAKKQETPTKQPLKK